MSLLHGRWRKRVSLLAAGALEGDERDATLLHLAACGECASELAALLSLLERVAADPIRKAEPALAVQALAARVQARLDAPVRRSPRPAPRLSWAVAAGAAMVATMLYLRDDVARRAPSPDPALAAAPVPEEVLRRLEGGLAREQAVRYLNQAQDVLVTVAAATRNCERESGLVDVEQEARRSRELLARRALLLEIEGDEVASARPVIEDVEAVLREVASLEACARSRDLRLLHDEIARRRLLMKIDLMTLELQG
jgi:hypothetical protein